MFDKQNHVQCKYQIVDCFCNVLKFSFNSSVSAMKGKLLDVPDETAKLNQHLKGIEQMPFVARERPLRKHLRKQQLELQKGKR